MKMTINEAHFDEMLIEHWRVLQCQHCFSVNLLEVSLCSRKIKPTILFFKIILLGIKVCYFFIIDTRK